MTDSTVPQATTRSVPTSVWHHVRCARCDEPIRPAFGTSMTQHGAWTQLTGRKALTMSVEPGYDTYVDQLPETEDRFIVLCQACVEWTRARIPGLDRLLVRMTQEQRHPPRRLEDHP